MIADSADEWWKLGSAEGGGLAMNNGVTICLNVMRTVMEHLGYGHLCTLDNEELAARLDPYGRCLGNYFARMSHEDKQRFRQLQGSDGQITGTRQCQEAIHAEFPQYAPPKLLEWIESRKKNYNDQGRAAIDEIERSLQRYVLQILKSEYDQDPDAWWWEGVPKSVRKKVDDRINESDGKTGGREQNFDLVHYREMITGNWTLFKDIFGFSNAGAGKDKQTSWIVEVGEMRNIVMHPSRQQFLTQKQISVLQTYVDWLKGRIQFIETGIESSKADDDGSGSEEQD